MAQVDEKKLKAELLLKKIEADAAVERIGERSKMVYLKIAEYFSSLDTYEKQNGYSFRGENLVREYNKTLSVQEKPVIEPMLRSNVCNASLWYLDNGVECRYDVEYLVKQTEDILKDVSKHALSMLKDEKILKNAILNGKQEILEMMNNNPAVE